MKITDFQLERCSATRRSWANEIGVPARLPVSAGIGGGP